VTGPPAVERVGPIPSRVLPDLLSPLEQIETEHRHVVADVQRKHQSLEAGAREIAPSDLGEFVVVQTEADRDALKEEVLLHLELQGGEPQLRGSESVNQAVDPRFFASIRVKCF